MKKLLLSSILLISGFSISAAALGGAGTIAKMKEAIEKARKEKLAGPVFGGTYNNWVEKELDESKSLLEYGKLDEAVKKIRAAWLDVKTNVPYNYSLGRTPGYGLNAPSDLLRAILEGKPEVISLEITKPEGLTGQAKEF